MGLIKDIRCLVAFMDGYIAPSLKMGDIDHVYFSDLWFVFTARSLIYMRDKKVPQKVWKVIQRTGGHYHHDTDPGENEHTEQPAGDRGGRHRFVIDCFHLDYDGIRYVQTYTQVFIDCFEDCQPLASLPVVPIRVAEKAGWIDRGAVVARGRQFVSCTRPQHRHYVGRHQILRPNGLQLHERDEQVPENAARYPEWIESEVMVDFERALQEMPGWRPGIDELKLFKAAAPKRRQFGIDIDTIWDSKLSEQVIFEEWEKCQRWDKERTGPSEEDDLLLLTDRIFAFVFRTRKWACLKLGRDNDREEMLREKKCRPEPWNDLQLPDGHKRLVQSLIESHSSKEGPRSLHFDLVRAKGKGVTILLHGVPGVGKTSTAECAAEANNRPLLPITCGDLGTKPREVEKKLEEAFQLAQLWSCVLLLDEADIFLAQRNESDIHRNALVSVFLRVLEYYEGILFLTTNRVGVFDEAFKSRIHLPLYYPPLNWKHTEKIWRTHLLKLGRSGLVDVDVEDIVAYAETFFERQSCRGSMIGPVWNGRQIRNAFQSAVALAGYRRGNGEGAGAQRIRIEREHFDRVAKTSNEFNHYIWSIKSANDADKAERMGIRYDGFQVDEMIHLKQHHAAPAPVGGVGGAAGGGGGGIAFGFSDRLATMAAAQNMNPPPMNNNQFQGFTNTGCQNQQQAVPNNSFSNQQRMMSMQQQHHHFQNQQPTMANSNFPTQPQSMQAGFPTQQQPNGPSGFPGQQQAMPANFPIQQQPYGQEGIGQQAPYSQP
ncbi:hypothetical protein MAPG_08529 [Magnaporthiopsis poae ATCC 64411]|uniref:AAA+ ATPase domain-containing protein n=1 Tax=Magnaporthiopsis poae (strain ATCC 64411 / 73-15) TaxID=644358 RepID=A0A0C4E7L5_MAGP6|nr:hypothetical protein MAPG_08529 [Magnaporthiopsis poae ATCC 64411]